MKKKYAYLFWSISGKGINRKHVFISSKELSKDTVKYELERWCSKFGAWHLSESHVSYGWKKITIPSRKELIKKYDIICKRKAKIHSKWQELAAMLNPTKI